MSLTRYESDRDNDGHRESRRAGGSGFRVTPTPRTVTGEDLVKHFQEQLSKPTGEQPQPKDKP